MLKKGHCVLLGGYRHTILDVNEDKVLVTHVSDAKGVNGKWLLKTLLPMPFARIDIE